MCMKFKIDSLLFHRLHFYFTEFNVCTVTTTHKTEGANRRSPRSWPYTPKTWEWCIWYILLFFVRDKHYEQVMCPC